MTCPNKYILINSILYVFFLAAITAVRSAHRNIDTRRAVGKTERL
jgi:hypothetical protein